MPQLKLNSLKQLRQVLGKSQREMAEQLGISLRAVQSYEQGWRTMPPAMQKLVSFLVYLKWRKDNPAPKPCWEVNGCSAEGREKCLAHQFQGGDCCWIVTGNRHCGRELGSWEEKIAKCMDCTVMQRWFPSA